jgi:hypothetical protein
MLRNHKLEMLRRRPALGMGDMATYTLVFSTFEGELIRPRNLGEAWWHTRARLEAASHLIPRRPPGSCVDTAPHGGRANCEPPTWPRQC